MRRHGAPRPFHALSWEPRRDCDAAIRESGATLVPGSPADKAGIVQNDILLEINGQRIDGDHPLATLVAKYNVGDQVSIKLIHAGAQKTVTVTLEQYKAS